MLYLVDLARPHKVGEWWSRGELPDERRAAVGVTARVGEAEHNVEVAQRDVHAPAEPDRDRARVVEVERDARDAAGALDPADPSERDEVSRTVTPRCGRGGILTRHVTAQMVRLA